MADDQKSTVGNNPGSIYRDKGVKIFTYPKIIFLFPTLFMSIVCWVGMWVLTEQHAPNAKMRLNDTGAVANQPGNAQDVPARVIPDTDPLPIGKSDPTRFRRPENLLGLVFLTVLLLNLTILAVDFPRFTILAILLLATTVTFFLLWLGMFVRILDPLERLFQRVYVEANTQFYFVLMMILLFVYGIIFVTRWLDYWEIMPNEILHHHGPLSDLERFPTLNLKFDKEIPDVFEHFMFGAGRLILHVANEHKSIVLDTVLHVSHKEEALKRLMSRLDVRVTTDQEVAQP